MIVRVEDLAPKCTCRLDLCPDLKRFRWQKGFSFKCEPFDITLISVDVFVKK